MGNYTTARSFATSSSGTEQFLEIPALLNCTVPGGNCKTRAAFTVKKPNRFMPFRSRPPNGERSLSDRRKRQQRDSLQRR
jgi:hypothetical protein